MSSEDKHYLSALIVFYHDVVGYSFKVIACILLSLGYDEKDLEDLRGASL